MFSSFHKLSEGGDLVGYEMWLVWVGEGHYEVVVQPSIDGPLPPIIAKAIVKGNEVSFVIPKTSKAAGICKGRVTAQGFDGACTGEDKVSTPLHLKRTQSYWQTH